MKKNSYSKLIKVSALTVCALAPTISASAQAVAPLAPTGNISASPTVAREGTKPVISWDITFPQPVTETVTIRTDGSIETKKAVRVEVKVLGAASQYTASNGSRKWKTTEGAIQVNSGAWTRFFRGTQPQVNATEVVEEITIPTGTVLNFRGRNQVSSNSSVMNAWWNTGVGGYNVLTMGDGDLPPIWSGTASQRDPSEFVASYVDSSGRLDIGARDIVVFFELGGTSNYWGHRDTQDLVLLVRFNEIVVDRTEVPSVVTTTETTTNVDGTVTVVTTTVTTYSDGTSETETTTTTE